MTPEHKALVAARAEVDAEHAKVNGDDGYNYAAGQEYGLRLALIVLDKHLAAIESLSAQCAQPQAGEAVAAHGYATRLLTSLMEKHYPDRSPEWAPLPDLYGVLTQIDNLSTGLVRASPQPANPAQGVGDEMVEAASAKYREIGARCNWQHSWPSEEAFHEIITAAIGAGGQAVADTPDALIEHMVQQFLRWKLPDDFNPDGGIQFGKRTDYGHMFEPVGTNLLDYQQAKAMVQHMLEGVPIAATSEPSATRSLHWIDVLREWFGGERYARDYEYLDANYSDQARRVEAYAATLSHPPQPADERVEGKPVELSYTNYRGETARRTITPKRIWFGSTEWHPEPQWLLTAHDHDKQADRDFALKDFGTDERMVEAHADDLAVDRFSAAMKAKLAKKRAEGRSGWDNRDECSAEHLSYLLIQHIIKGDPLDVGNLAMMLHQRGDRIVIDDETRSIAAALAQEGRKDG